MIEPVPVADSSAARPIDDLPGVLAVHDPRPPLTRAMSAAASALRIDAAPPVDGIHLTNDDTGVTASAAVSVRASSRAPEVARAVADELLARHPEAARIAVEVRRIA